MSAIDDVKAMLSDNIDNKLEVIERLTTARLKSILGGVDFVPQEMDYIVTEVCIKRFNRVGNEGFASYSQEGSSISFPDSDFAEYQSVIDEFKRKADEEFYKPKKGVVRFL